MYMHVCRYMRNVFINNNEYIVVIVITITITRLICLFDEEKRFITTTIYNSIQNFSQILAIKNILLLLFSKLQFDANLSIFATVLLQRVSIFLTNY